MSEIKELYVIEWMGPYKSLDDICNYDDTMMCRFYLLTGRLGRETNGIKYVGITKRYPEQRLSDKDDLKKQEMIKEKQYWVGRFSVSSYNNLDKPRNRNRAELIERLIIRYLYESNVRIINTNKTQSDPENPVGIISRWLKKDTNALRSNKPSVLQVLPDVLLFCNGKYLSAPNMRIDIESGL